MRVPRVCTLCIRIVTLKTIVGKYCNLSKMELFMLCIRIITIINEIVVGKIMCEKNMHYC